MIAATNSAAPRATPPATIPATDVAPARPGKSGMAVGQLAKQAVAAAKEAGIGVPKNAQGFAASQIAKGADPASIFAAQISETPDMGMDDVSAEAPNEDIDLQAGAATGAPPSDEMVVTPDAGDGLVAPTEAGDAALAAVQYDATTRLLADAAGQFCSNCTGSA